LEIFFMGQEILGEVDLFGCPVLVREAKRGRPEHQRTPGNAKRVSMLFAMGRDVADVALALGVSQPTLRKHYFSEVEQRKAMLDRLEADQLAKLFDQSAGGSTAATKALLDRCDDARMARLAGLVAKGRRPDEVVAPKGKKEQRLDAARNVGSRYAPRVAPGLRLDS
jgi:heme exporter protein D